MGAEADGLNRHRAIVATTREAPAKFTSATKYYGGIAMEPKGREGWLAFLIFVLIATTVIVFFGNIAPITEAEQRGFVWPNGFKPVFYLAVLLSAGVIATAAWMLIKHDDWYAVNIAIKCMWAGLFASIYLPVFVLTSYIPELIVPKEVVKETFSGLVWLTVWTLYLLKSKRVRNTYSIGAPRLNGDSSTQQSSLKNLFEPEPAAQEPEQAAANPTPPPPPPAPAPMRPALVRTAQPPSAVGSLKFTMFRADADGKWYWVLQETLEGRVLSRSSGKANRSECLRDIELMRSAAASALVWDKTANEYVLGP